VFERKGGVHVGGFCGKRKIFKIERKGSAKMNREMFGGDNLRKQMEGIPPLEETDRLKKVSLVCGCFWASLKYWRGKFPRGGERGILVGKK